MELDEIQTLKRIAKEIGIEYGPELIAFLRDERARGVGIIARELGTMQRWRAKLESVSFVLLK